MNEAPVTIKDIARILDISAATVSRALNNHPAISIVTTERVKKLALELGYQTNIAAYNLKKRKSKSVGILVPDLSHHYFSSIIKGAQEFLYTHGYSTLFSQTNENGALEQQAIRSMMANNIDGLLVSMSIDAPDVEYYKQIIAKGLPVVFFDRYDFSLEATISSVTVNDFQGAFEATNALIAKGAKRIALLAMPDRINTGYNRIAGFRKAMQDAQLPVNPDMLLQVTSSVSKGKEAIAGLLQKQPAPDAILCTTGLLTLGALEYRKQNSQKWFEIGGFLNDLYEGYHPEQMIRVVTPTLLMGQKAASLLLDAITDSTTDIRKVVLPITLVQD